MAALARGMCLNASTVSRWEDGTSAPDAETLIQLASHLNVRPEFFLRPVHASDRPVFLRSLATTLVRDLDYQQAQMRWLQEISHAVEHYVDLPEVDLPDVLGNSSYKQLRDDDLEKIALDLRAHWKMGDGPCTDVVALMERVGIIVSVIEMGTIRLDGLCSWSPIDGRPHVLLAMDKMSFVRRQMDAAHEMAHALLHHRVTDAELKRDLKMIETQAFRLASAFLMPSTSYPLEIRSASLAAMITSKERWRVSIKAQIKRLADLEIIAGETATHLYKMYSAKGWSQEEPLDKHWEPAEPRVLKDSLHLIVDENVRSKIELQSLEFAFSAGDVENLAGLSPGWFSKESAEVVHVQLKDRSLQSSEFTAQILSFPINRDNG